MKHLAITVLLPLLCLAADAPKEVTLLGYIDYKPCTESSGVIASRKHPGVFWTHCDSGNDAAIYAITREGKFIAEYKVNVKNEDWEDISIDDKGHLFIGDIGNNGGKHNSIHVYRLDEPDPVGEKPHGGIGKVKVDKTWKIAYPDQAFDAESLFIWKDHGYIISKLFTGLPATIYKFPLHEKKDVTLEKVCSLPIHSPATAADISADGKKLAVLSLGGLSVFQIDGDIASAANAPFSSVRFVHPSAEGCCFAPDGVLVTAESREVWLFVPPEPGAAKIEKEAPPPPATTTAKTTATPHTPTAPQISIHALAKSPTIDGNLDDWDKTKNELTVKSTHRVEDKQPTARAWAGWTAKGIYLAAIIPADGLRPLEQDWYSGDSAEVFIGPQSSDRADDWTQLDDRCYLGFAKAPDGTCGKFEIHWPRHDDDKGPAESAAAGGLNKDGTYQFELFLPAAMLGGNFAKSGFDAGAAVRFDVSILSKKPRRNWYVGKSNSDGCWMGPANWGIVTLEK